MDAGVGGQLQGISLDSFLQMVQMEKTTCTLKVVSGKNEGTLFVLDGELIAAETQDLQNFEAACAVISWNDAVIEIENTCTKTENEINQPLMHVLMEGLKLKDEQSASPPDDEVATVPSEIPQTAEEKSKDTPDLAATDEAEPEPEEAFELNVAPKKKKGTPKIALICVFILVGVAAAYFTLLGPGSSDIERAYQDVLAEVDLTSDVKKKISLLRGFIEAAEEPNEWTAAANLKMTEIKELQAGEAYREVALQADKHVKAGEFLPAAALYKAYLSQYAGSTGARQARTEVTKLADMAEKADYKAVTAVIESGDVSRIDVLRDYLKNHPKSEQADGIKKQIATLEADYFAYTEKQIGKSAMVEEWADCIQRVNQYTEIYPDGPNTKKLSKYLRLFEKNRLEYTDYETIMEKAHAAGADYAKAQMILAKYLQSFPGTHLADKIEDQINHYKKLDEEAKINDRTATVETLLQKTRGRFTTKGDGTFTDTRTGRMWCTLDSRSVLDNCLNYDSAIDYIQALNTGGYRDWRLPSPVELKTLMKEEPVFPAPGSEWLWTSKVLKKYVDEWLIDVTVITADQEPATAGMVKDSRYCGNVRAVRR